MASRSTPVKQSKLRFRFINETIAELKKVVWLTRREIVYLTTVILIVFIIVGLMLGIIDYGFTRLINDVFLGR